MPPMEVIPKERPESNRPGREVICHDSVATSLPVSLGTVATATGLAKTVPVPVERAGTWPLLRHLGP